MQRDTRIQELKMCALVGGHSDSSEKSVNNYYDVQGKKKMEVRKQKKGERSVLVFTDLKNKLGGIIKMLPILLETKMKKKRFPV